MKQRTRSLAIFYTALALTVAAVAAAIVIQHAFLDWNNWAGAAIVGVCLALLTWRVHSGEELSQKNT